MIKESDKLPLFYDIKNVQVRTWNRCAMFFRAAKEGLAEADHYLKRLDDIGRQQVKNMLKDIRDQGYTQVRRSVVESVK